MRQLQRQLTPQQEAGKAVFLSLCTDPGDAMLSADAALRSADAYLRTLIVLPKGGKAARLALRAEIRRRKL
jgi:ethanolamine utilization microcompartment shell protein EutL